jgi:acyl phosphate:glycerol-3-phosphate acyltransferase
VVASVFAPTFYVFGSGVVWPMAPAVAVVTVLMCMMLLWRHRENIGRLLAGQESKIGSKKK